jgi:putative ABC transport system ATP-binding protein
MMTSIVSLENISKGFRDGESFHPVLNQVKLTLHQGQTIALTGPSGSGKSTLLNIIGGFERLDSGDMLIRQGDGLHSVKKWQDRHWSQYRRQSLGVIFQQYNLLTPLNVRDNIQFSALGVMNYAANWD